jgi:hypothetical protein
MLYVNDIEIKEAIMDWDCCKDGRNKNAGYTPTECLQVKHFEDVHSEDIGVGNER